MSHIDEEIAAFNDLLYFPGMHLSADLTVTKAPYDPHEDYFLTECDDPHEFFARLDPRWRVVTDMSNSASADNRLLHASEFLYPEITETLLDRYGPGIYRTVEFFSEDGSSDTWTLIYKPDNAI